MKKYIISGTLLSAMISIAILGLGFEPNEVLVTSEEIISTNFTENNLPATKILPCIKEETGLRCNYYITTIQTDNTPDGIVYEIGNSERSVFLSANEYNNCRKIKTEIECKKDQNIFIEEKISEARNSELEIIKQIQLELVEEKNLFQNKTEFDSELSPADISIK